MPRTSRYARLFARDDSKCDYLATHAQTQTLFQLRGLNACLWVTTTGLCAGGSVYQKGGSELPARVCFEPKNE